MPARASTTCGRNFILGLLWDQEKYGYESWYTFEVKFTFLTHHVVAVGKLSCHQSRSIKHKTATQMHLVGFRIETTELPAHYFILYIADNSKWEPG